MANIGDFQMPRISEKEKRRAIRWGVIVLLLLVFFVVILGTLSPYVDYLWYAHDVRQPQVFTLAYETKGILFLPAFFVAWGLLHFSLKRAFRLSLIYIENPASTGEVLISNALHFVQDRGWNFVRILAPVVAFFSASGFSNEWSTFLLARHAQAFGMKDPIFGFDLGFFVFQLPWYRAIVGYVFAILFLTTILTVAIYAGLQLLAAMAKVELGRPNIRMHIGLLAGLTLIVFAVQLFLKTYGFGLAQGSQFTGAGYAASYELHAQQFIAVLVGMLGVVTLFLSRSTWAYFVLIRGAIGIVAVYVLAVVIAPFLIQRTMVEPDKLNKEGPYAARAIRMTRFAYGLDKIAARDFAVQNTPSAKDLQASQATLDNMRLWDPEIVRTAIEILQGLKPYYRFNDVDVDRYRIGGKATEVMLSPRDVNLDGLSANARTWVNERLQYTHGFGVVVASVNSATSDGQPSMLVKDIPPTTPSDLPLTEPRIYYSDFRDENHMPIDEYALVDSNQPEFDYPAQDKETTNRWTGSGGIPIGGLFRRLALSTALGDGNLLISSNISGDSRLLMHRGVLDRCSRLYPFLQFDDDPYIVLLNGKVYWIADGYTTTDKMPYSDMTGIGDQPLNYIRNTVKVIVDAYSGETTAYAIDPNEPILKAYREIYPNLIHDISEIPKGFAEHFRYPETMFRLQAAELTQSHVTDPIAFLNNNDAWETPQEKGRNGTRSPLAPYYVLMSLPGESTDEFVLMLPFTPRGKANMSGWLAAHCDPGRYGQLVLYNFAKGANVAGAEQMETTFGSDPKVNSARLQLQGGGTGDTDVVIGNMLVIPIGDSVMYAESLFPMSRTSGLQAMPRLKKVVLGINGRLEVGDTYQEALDKLFGPTNAPIPPTTPAVNPPTTSPGKPGNLEGVREALGLLDQADAALRSGDFARYGELQKKARAKLQGLVGK
ncbi:MAG TPA: UPF0182 family protein [Fimbriimonadaceae bacterium]|nr:UPF0182 family protein [Fimbriimonadaceae bacterium]